jgi:Protein of unknown function (DUF3102)
MTQLAQKEETRLARPLAVLIPSIRVHMYEAKEAEKHAGEKHYIAAGRELKEAKPQVKKGHWTSWVKQHFNISKQTADDWMLLAEHEDRRPAGHPTVSYMPRREKIREARQHRQATIPAGFIHHAQERNKERETVRELGFQLIKAGYRALAEKLHPDKGGSGDDMARLNKVRELLENSL